MQSFEHTVNFGHCQHHNQGERQYWSSYQTNKSSMNILILTHED